MSSSNGVIDLTEDDNSKNGKKPERKGTAREGDTAKGTGQRKRTVRSDSSSGSDDVLQVKQPAKKKAKQGKKAKAAKKAHFEGWISDSQLESFVSRHGLLTDWPLRMVHPQSNKLKKYCLLAFQHGHWYMLLVNKTVSPGYYAMLNSLTGDSENPKIKKDLPGLENRTPLSVPKQQNGVDCGAYFARFAEIVSGVKTSTPGWSDIPRRMRMARNDVTADDVRRIRADVGAN